MLDRILATLEGRKTYLAAAAFAAVAVWYATHGQPERATECAAMALGLAGIRQRLDRDPPAPPGGVPATLKFPGA